MPSSQIEKSLAQVELQFNAVSAALISADPLALESASAGLRQASVDFSQLLQSSTVDELAHGELKLRLKKIAEGMLMQRESLIRRAGVVDRALNVMVPATRAITYSQGSGGPYGDRQADPGF